MSISADAQEDLALSWTNKLLTVSGRRLPGGKLEILYLEAFCRKGSTQRDWKKTVLPHKTKLIFSDPKELRFRTVIEPDALMLHEVRANSNGIDLHFAITNQSQQPLDLEWFQPACIRVATFTGLEQSNYISRSFIFTEQGLTTLGKTRREEEGFYRGGQVYVPEGVNLEDVNPRPISKDQPINGLIGCFSGDGRQLLATASSNTQELFEGVFVCLHSDPRIGGLAPGETKEIRAKIYLLTNDLPQLLDYYHRDFPEAAISK
jgi:hypothetical protein